jgi:hypothetical protein
MPRHARHQDAGPGSPPLTGPANGGAPPGERDPREAREAEEGSQAGSAQIELILRDPPEYVETAKVFDILMAVPKFGRVKAARFLNQCRISQSKTVGGLSDRQRAELVALLRR